MEQAEEGGQPKETRTVPRRPYEIPKLQLFGNAATLTQRVSMRGLPDGSGNSGSMSRTG